MVHAVRLLVLISAYGLTVMSLAAAGAGAWTDVRAPGPLRPDAAVEFAGLIAAWACLIWWGVGFAIVVLAAVPGAIGRLAAACAARIAPAAVRRLARFALGAAVVSGTTVTVAVPAGAIAAAPALSPRVDDPIPGLPSLDRPTMAGPARATPDQAAPTPDVGIPPRSTIRPTASPAVVDRTLDALGLVPADRHPAPHRHGLRTPPARRDAVVVVRTGDTLWGIAARHLSAGASSARIAAEWPRWYRANAHVVGADPDLIRPGQRLRPAPSADSHSQETR